MGVADASSGPYWLNTVLFQVSALLIVNSVTVISHSLMLHIGNSSAPSVNTSEETSSHFDFISTSQVTTVQSAKGTTKYNMHVCGLWNPHVSSAFGYAFYKY